jgi:hypothetical protein
MYKALAGVVSVVSFALVVGGGLGGQHRSAGTQARAGQAEFASLPLAFAVNRGQLDARVSYAVQGRDASAFFTRRGVTYVLGGSPRTAASTPSSPSSTADRPQRGKAIASQGQFLRGLSLRYQRSQWTIDASGARTAGLKSVPIV